MTVPSAARPLLSTSDVVEHVGRVSFKTGPPGRVGIEAEWLVLDAADPGRPVPIERTQRALDIAGLASPLPAGSLLSFEPGGQLELSTCPAAGAPAACAALTADLALVERAVAVAGLRLLGAGVDPLRPPARALRTPRYDAMERNFDIDGPAGRVMMCSTAAVQVCLDSGVDDADVRRRRRLAGALVPVLVAAFANSPRRLGRTTGWRSTRQAVWSAIEPARAGAPADDDPALGWARSALDARVLLVPREGGGWHVAPGITFAEWLAGAPALPRPTAADLDRHLSTLFPPVRPRGRWFEVRCIDALPEPLWRVPVAVVTALLDDPAAADVAWAAVEPLRARPDAVGVAARRGLTAAALRAAARACFAATLDALPRLRADAAAIAAVADYAERYVERGRSPADDTVDADDALLSAAALEVSL